MPELLRILHLGQHGEDVAMAQMRLKNNRWNRRFYKGTIDGDFGRETQLAAIRAKWRLGYPADRINGTYGPQLHGFLVPLEWKAGERLPLSYRTRRVKRLGDEVPASFIPSLAPRPGYPLSMVGEQIGYPYQGSHDHPSPSDSLHNWESCNAVDVGVPPGTGVLAVADGQIGDRFGPLSSSNPVLLGIRLHLLTAHNDFYYAHLRSTAPGLGPGDRVHRGQLLGQSGVANGVAHLHFAADNGDPGIWIGHPTPGYSDRNYP